MIDFDGPDPAEELRREENERDSWWEALIAFAVDMQVVDTTP